MNAGFNVKPGDVPAEIMDTILILESEINSYKKKKQKEIEQKMRSTQSGI